MSTENETEQQRHCWDCRYYNAYYTKGNNQFDKVKQGYCKKRDTTTANHESCETWTYHAYPRKVYKSHALMTLENIANSLTGVAQILREAEEEKNLK